jgi:hypothetical protein
LDVNLRNGALLSFAVREKNIILLGRILSANPSITSLAAAFRTATSSKPRSLELDTMKLLLEKAKSAEIGQSEALLQQIKPALSGDFAGLRLLLHHKAVATSYTVMKACLATASSKISSTEKQEIFESLLASSAEIVPEDMSKLLRHSVANLPECTQLPRILVAHGAEIKFESLKVALAISSLELLELLVSSIKSNDIAVKTFKYVRQMTMASDRKYWIYQHLLAKGIPSDDVSEALLDFLKAGDLGDLSFLKLLLDNGASPGYKKGELFSVALRAKSPNSRMAVRLLTQHVTDNSTATVAFDVVRRTPLLKSNVRVEIYRPLLEWKIAKLSLSQVLVESFKGGLPDISFLKLLLEKGADPNKDKGRCFVVAAKMKGIEQFLELSKYTERRQVLEVLLSNLQEESDIVTWFKFCLQTNPRSRRIDGDELLFQCMRKFPGGTTLLKLLLDQGVPASAKRDHPLCASWKPEPCTAIIWALFARPRIENNVILVLLSRGNSGTWHIHQIAFPYH